MKEKKVTGVLNRNSSIRGEHLKRNYGKYSQYTDNLTPAIGEVIQIDYNRPMYSITDGQSLLEYTSDIYKPYGSSIERKYFNGREKEVIGFNSLTPDQYLSWGGKYLDYTQYLDDVLGDDIVTRHINYVNNFLSGQFIENALRQTEVGVVRDFNVAVARQGIITTNINNLKGVDTPLGTITNTMYSSTLYNGAIFNSDRKSEEKYITPSLVNQYGNNLSNIMELSDILRVGTGQYRLREDLGADARIMDYNEAINSDLNTRYLQELIDESSRYLNKNNSEFRSYEIGSDGYIGFIDDIKEFERKNIFTSVYKHNTDRTYGIYNEYDSKYIQYGENIIYESDDINIDTDFSEYDEDEIMTSHDDASWEDFKTIPGHSKSVSLLSKTAQLFKDHKLNTLIGRFHTSADGGISEEQEFIDTAKSRFGNSHGRNLLTRDAQDGLSDTITNGYHNPYCRTWTFHHQYNQVKKLIRPFIEEDEFMSIADVQDKVRRYRSKDDLGNTIGGNYLANNTVLNENGFVNICPSGNQDVGGNGIRIEKCMFSIENLAWKDVPKFTKENYISKEQTGPNGGRIMWFPPYDLSFNENINVDWKTSSFIGRGEKVYTYTNTDRSGTLSFTLLIDHPSIINSYARLNDGDLSSDIDADILRYFAGCELPNLPKEEPRKRKKTRIVRVQRKPVVIPDKPGSFSFYVYFPNNYSGVVTDKSGKEIKVYDSNWWKYILTGNNGGYAPSIDDFRGYEVTLNSGITTEDESNTIGVAQCWWDNPGSNSCIGEVYEYNKNIAKQVTGTTNDHYKYRVDYDLRQRLAKQVNYKDTTSHQLNTNLDTEKYQKDADYSFGEVVLAMIKSNLITAEESFTTFLYNEGGCNTERINELSDILSSEGLMVKSINVEGCADQNDKKNADMLARRRASSIRNFFTEFRLFDKEKTILEIKGKKSIEKAKELTEDIKNKLNRFAFVTVNYLIPGTRQEFSEMSFNETNPILSAITGDTQTYEFSYETIETIEEPKEIEFKSIEEQYIYKTFAETGKTRYETEAEYFEKLEKDHPLIFKSIKDKFNYFNPAFHSMSPEGFNARLNFLHQCTRQGHTYESKAGNGIVTAHNLAFGRMPVCVLRIGDFINTRIIINNVQINYDNNGIQWDLNPEGIGVQPMYAKVNLGITIIGGQSLEGPISRLQNAVSFDYYANTGVYDDRADRYTVDQNGNVNIDKIFTIGGEKNISDNNYTLYRTNNNINNSNTSDYIDDTKSKKAAYDNSMMEELYSVKNPKLIL